jgi:hypothetical protein
MPTWSIRQAPATSMVRISAAGPLVERKPPLDDLHLVGPAWATNSCHPDGDALFEVCVQQGYEGVVAKRLDSPYLPGVRARELGSTVNQVSGSGTMHPVDAHGCQPESWTTQARGSRSGEAVSDW